MRWTCHFVPALLGAALLLPGCYLVHEAETGPCPRPAGVCCAAGVVVPFDGCGCPFGSSLRESCEGVDAGPGPIDAGPPIDASVDAGPLMCPLVRADATCMEGITLRAGAPFVLPVTFDTCVCCAQSECRVEVEGDHLHLTTTLCPDPCDCDTCYTPIVECLVPALEERVYDVFVNDAPAYRAPAVRPSPGLIPEPPTCYDHAEVDACRLSDAYPDPTGWRPSGVCVERRPGAAGPEEVVVTLQSDCWGCGDLEGPCVVSIEPRFTDDLPPGGEIRVRPSYYPTSCDVSCPTVCISREVECFVPPLTPGDYYRVWLDGEAMLSFVAGEVGGTCTVGPPPPG